MHLLVIEDERALCETIVRSLRRLAYSVDYCYDGEKALALLGVERYDLVLLDLNLPKKDGMTVLRTLRQTDRETRVLILSARSEVEDKVQGLDAGANDYLAKPFDLDELLARVSVQLRHASRGAGRSSGTLRFKDWVLDAEARTLTAAGDPVRLTRLEFGIVEALVRRPKKVFTKRELFQAAWNEEAFVEEKAVNVHVSNIRGKLKPSGTDGYIETVWGIGFKLAE